jgi:hypothetical protein
VFLRIEPRGLDGCAGIEEEESGHSECCGGCYYRLEVGVSLMCIRNSIWTWRVTRPLMRYRGCVGRETSAKPSVDFGTDRRPPMMIKNLSSDSNYEHCEAFEVGEARPILKSSGIDDALRIPHHGMSRTERSFVTRYLTKIPSYTPY